jgi:flagellar hook assembly protein FlgD
LAHVFLGEALATSVEILPTAGLWIGPAVPNPSRSTATFSAHLDREEPLAMSIVDSSGRRVRNYPPRTLAAGSHQLDWDGRDQEGKPVASGVYFVRLDLGSESTLRKVILLRD